jgi:hypothetical protein
LIVLIHHSAGLEFFKQILPIKVKPNLQIEQFTFEVQFLHPFGQAKQLP